ncbi:Stk1 family PASTA domain-containing Ser/Thr kinase [Actinoalloteichus spitiensis]|uniref:Stk1 family PASTA domain-containing Ser/Thr kinase n=1 Tax=Actinoalloteichus spitiensis TaxID=252394 RepID=UPI00037F3C4D|nr:Stk1 family PASTA domain-containing Ser/Thr kinase [Actinoalloteichus spitiensis]
MSTQRLLSNRYELGGTLGYGGMSEVHQGRDVRLSRDVAVKVLRADLARDPTFQLRFRREAQNAAALNHPAIVAVYDTGETETEYGPLPYIVMEYVDGRTLRDMVKGDGPLSNRRAMEVMADACAALDFSHRHGIIHRDVKPANIMITKSGAVKVMDFGIARALHDGQAAVTQTAAVIGTAQYLSPEQARGEAVDARSDVYAAGCVLFELLTGEPPFTGDSPVAVAYQHVREDPRRPSEVNSRVSAALDAIVLKAMSKNPANRYQSAAEMRTDLVRVLSGQRPSAPMVMTDEERTSMMGADEGAEGGRHRSDEDDDYDELAEEEERRRRRRKGWTAALVTVLCVVVLGLGAWWASGLLGDQQPSDPAPGVDEPAVVSVPDLVGLTAEEAAAELEELGLVGEEHEEASDEVEEGMVIRSEPDLGSEVREGDTVAYWVSTGPDSVEVPELSGLTSDEAKRRLEEHGLDLDPAYSYEPTSDPNLVDRVVAQTPAAGSGPVPVGTSVSITLGREREQSTVPSVVGQQFDSAESLLNSLGFEVSRRNVSGSQPAGEVVAQSPDSGSKVDPGATITLDVSEGDQLTMTDLAGMTVDEAQEALESDGWTGSLEQTEVPVDNLEQDGQIVSQSPSPGATLGRNQSVQVQVGSFSVFPSG